MSEEEQLSQSGSPVAIPAAEHVIGKVFGIDAGGASGNFCSFFSGVSRAYAKNKMAPAVPGVVLDSPPGDRLLDPGQLPGDSFNFRFALEVGGWPRR